MRTTTWPAPGVGAGTSSMRITSGLPNCRTRTARIEPKCYHQSTAHTGRMETLKLHRTVGVKVGRVQVGGGAPIVVQSMTMTDTADARATAAQCVELAEAGSEMVRVTVNTPEAAAAVPEIKARMRDAGCGAPLIGAFHYNGHLPLTRFPACAAAVDQY